MTIQKFNPPTLDRPKRVNANQGPSLLSGNVALEDIIERHGINYVLRMCGYICQAELMKPESNKSARYKVSQITLSDFIGIITIKD